MKKLSFLLIITAVLCGSAAAQKKRPRTKPKAASAVKQAAVFSDVGKVSGRTYTNRTLGFAVTFPDTWLIPDNDFEAYMKSQGFDLSLKAPDTLAPSSKAAVNRALQNVNVLLTAYRSMPGMADNAIVRISIEDLKANPQIKDAVDYFDAMRATYAKMRLPADFKYSETQAEKLGDMQFGFIDASSSAGKKRMYGFVRDGRAVLFTISYSKDEDVATLREALAGGNFKLAAN